jgi:hypothetical protein
MLARICFTSLLLAACARPSLSPVDRLDASAALGGNGPVDASTAFDFAARRAAGDAALSPPADLARLDLAVERDLARVHDMTAIRDLASPHDLAVGHDMTTVGDMTVDTCGHSLCSYWNQPMTDGCHWCVTKICAVDNYCCTNHWSTVCVKEVGTICKISCN